MPEKAYPHRRDGRADQRLRSKADKIMKRIALAVALASLAAGCVTPIETGGADARLAGHCKLVAYQIDQTAEQGVRHGAFGFVITQSNENARRQEIYNACVQAGGN
jgi:hypothetical protein